MKSEFWKEAYVLDKMPFEERRVIHALVVFWKCTSPLQLDQVRPSLHILGLIDKCSIGIDFFRQVHRDLCSNRRIKYIGFSESEFKQFLEDEYHQPVQIFVEHRTQTTVEELKEYERRARAEFDAFVYKNHCWNCQMAISSEKNVRCSGCKLFICDYCGACFCNRTSNLIHYEAVDPFLPDYPDDIS